MFAPNKLCLFLCYFIGFLILCVRSQSNIDLNDTNPVESNVNLNGTVVLETLNATPVNGTEKPSNESSFATKIDFMAETDEDSSDKNLKKILCSSDTVIYMYEFYRLFTPIFVRFIFGIAVSVKKVKRVFTHPVGLGIVLFSNFIIMPLLNYGLGWMFFVGSYERVSLFLGGATSFKGVFSNCWTVVLNGNIELSIVMSIAVTILSTIFHPKFLFKLCEGLFTGGSFADPTHVDLDIYHIVWTLCSTIIPFLLGLSIQNCCRFGKKIADKTIEHVIFSYILTNFGIMTAYTVVDWIHSEESFEFHLLEFLMPIIRYLAFFFIAKCLSQETEDCIAIAIETTVPRQNVSTSLPMVTHFIIQLFREESDISQSGLDYYRSCPTNQSQDWEEVDLTRNPNKQRAVGGASSNWN